MTALSEMVPSNYEEKKTLSSFASDVYSQWGEDGIIEKIFSIIEVESKVCIEFGAWDGFHLANTADLWGNKGWEGILIEGHKERFLNLQENTSKYKCTCINAYVSTEGENSLEGLLKSNKIAVLVDLLSIDIDGNDYFIFDSLESLRPRVIVCEYNPTIPAHLDVYQAYGDQNFGCSVSALLRIAHQKGYSLVAITDTNCFFVLEQYKGLFAAYETRPEVISINRHLTYLMTNYSGDYVASTGGLPYGCNFPIKGELNGDIRPLHFRPPSLSILYSTVRKLKSFIRSSGLWTKE
jgi:hypothetical protein